MCGDPDLCTFGVGLPNKAHYKVQESVSSLVQYSVQMSSPRPSEEEEEDLETNSQSTAHGGLTETDLRRRALLSSCIGELRSHVQFNYGVLYLNI